MHEEQAIGCPTSSCLLPLQFAKQFQQRGNQVIATVRQQGATQQLQDALGGDVTVMQLDVADPASVAAFADTAKGVVDHIDVLINNAGAACLLRAAGAPHHLSSCVGEMLSAVSSYHSRGDGRAHKVQCPAAVDCLGNLRPANLCAWSP